MSGRRIGTTAEHPFYVVGKGWKPAGELQYGDVLSSHNASPGVVESVTQDEEMTIVYNLRVAGFHTYFVGCDEWGFSVWAHNTCFKVTESPTGLIQIWDDSGKLVLKADRKTLGAEFHRTFNGMNLPEAQKTALMTDMRNALEAKGLNLAKPSALELKPLVPGSDEWKAAVQAIRSGNGHGVNFRTKNQSDAMKLLYEAKPELKGNAISTKQNLQEAVRDGRGYQQHGPELEGNAPENVLPHLKWRDNTGGQWRGDGHIFW